MREVYKSLYVGSEDDVPKAKERGYAILTCAKDGKVSHRGLLGYTSMGAPKGPEYLAARRKDHLYLNMVDADSPEFFPDKLIDTGLDFITENLDKNKPVLVQCVEGKSRSASLVLLWLYLAGKLHTNYNEAVKQFRRIYPDYDPADGIRLAVKERIRRHR